MSLAPLIWADDLDAPLAWREGHAISRRHYLADVQQLAVCLPEAGAMLNLTVDGYRFAVAWAQRCFEGRAACCRSAHSRGYSVRSRSIHVHGVCGRQQAALPSKHRCAQAHREAITIDGQVEHGTGFGQAHGELCTSAR